VGLNAVAIKFHLMPPAGTALAGIGLHGEMKRNSGTASGCSGIAPGGQLGFVAELPLRTESGSPRIGQLIKLGSSLGKDEYR
jgi:hypothetical protein